MNHIFLNGKINQFKIYYENGEIKFEGEYKNEKIWNSKEYDTNKNIIFQLKNGKGYIKDYNYDYHGKLEYEGEFLHGKRNGKGKGKEYYRDGKLSYEGEYLNGKRNGKGKEFSFSGKLIFEGEYVNGERNGKGKEYNYDG